MSKHTRRSVLRTGVSFAVPSAAVTLLAGCNQTESETAQQEPSGVETPAPEDSEASSESTSASMTVQYLEIVTPEVEALCEQYSKAHGVTFSEPVVSFGGARTAKLNSGGMIGIRGPLRDTETPVVRPYMLVDDIAAAVKSAADAGAEVAMPPMEIPEHGMFAIVIHGGIECGFWQN